MGPSWETLTGVDSFDALKVSINLLQKSTVIKAKNAIVKTSIEAV